MTKTRRSLGFALIPCCTLFVLAACQAPLSSVTPDARAQTSALATTKKLPASILYALGGKATTKAPYIQVFDAENSSPNPKPIYTIAPVSHRGYSLLAVDGQNNLFAITDVGDEPAIKMFAAGASKTTIACQLPMYPQGMYVANGLLYLTFSNNTIQELAEPLRAGKTCPAPVRTLTDKLAGREGDGLGLFGVAADKTGNVFDTWQASPSNGEMDRFGAGKDYATKYAYLGSAYTSFYLSISAHDDIATGVCGYTTGPLTCQLAVFPNEAKVAKTFNPTGETNGAYLGTGFGKDDTEIFTLYDYPVPTITAYAFDPATGKVGKLLRTFSGLYYYEQEFALYAPGS